VKQSLSDSIDDYIAHGESRGLSKETIKGQRVTLRKFLTIAGNILTENVHEGHVDAYFRKAAETRSKRSLGLDTSILRGFFKWAVRTRRAGRSGNPMGDRRAPKVAPREWRGFSVSKVPALLDAATHPRDRMLLALAIYLIGRSNEFEILRIGDLRLDAGEITYKIPKTFKADILPITEELDEELRRWLTAYTRECGPLDPNWYLVPAKTPPSMKGTFGPVKGAGSLVPTKRMREMHEVAQKALTAIGFAIRDENGKSLGEGMHTIRRSIARGLHDQLRDEGDPSPVETVRAMLNHSTEKQTRDYIGLQSHREHRDARLKGRPMFPGLRPGNVHRLDEVRRAREDQAQ